ncbi:ChbG/HpnK family deacetylase [Bacillus wiedmannii]|uniref:ChbG/HpnK family deacetylase n=1 Tax=Bacillus wiedmannii TaxID=1890302 RepID=A0A4U2MJS5_9BACI|nr:ChbG/HpnK family deacetylase [Bacillus wiedmannii]TKH11345.1 ChbG/HpnK family deacetylase [Bacillus wiedmannii]
MANMPGFKNAVERIQANPQLDVGLHFNLTCGKPVRSTDIVPSLVDENKAHFLKTYAMQDM